jgi:hypothetical protein
MSSGVESSEGWSLHVLDVGCHDLFLVIRGTPQRESEALVELATLLLRRYEP